jgi:serine/threonine-protein kinase
MKREKWASIQSIVHDALELPTTDREQFIVDAAADDAFVLDEVRAFLAVHDTDADTFLDRPIAEFNRDIFADENDEPSLSGLEIGGYRIGRRLGKGGMGDVYYAEDLALNRPVALKFLSAEFSRDDNAKSHLRREAKSLSVLNHPNICGVHTFADPHGYTFIVMEYVEGESLSSLIRDRRLEPAAAFSVGVQIVSAIAAAHEQKIIHCDIKPGNVIVTKDGVAKVLDFGLAKVVHDHTKPNRPADRITQAVHSVQIGTAAYMSPEQHEGRELDYSADVFSLGTLLYELNIGEHPFERDDVQSTKEAILDGELSFTSEAAKNIRPGLQRVLKKCLAPETEHRYPDATQLYWDLQHLQRSWLKAFAKRALPFIVIALFVAALISTVYYFRDKEKYSVAILPFSNETFDGQFDYLSDGIAENLVDRMTAARGFSVVPYTKLTNYTGANLDLGQIGRTQNADLVVYGRIFRSDAKLGLETKLIDAKDGSVVRVSHVDLRADEIQTAEIAILENLFSDLDIWPFEPVDNADQRTGETKIPEAFRQYLIGRNHWRKRDKENIEQAIAAYQKAIDLDPRYARAWAGMAECWVLMSSVAYGSATPKESFAKARAAARQALEIDPNDAEARTALGVVLTKHDWKWVDAETEYRRAIEDAPDYGLAHYWLSGLLGITGRINESIAEAEKAKELEPYSPLVEYNLSRSYYFARQWEKSLEVLNRLSDADKKETRFLYQSGLILLQMGRHEEALASFRSVEEKNPMLAAAAMGQTLAKMGRIHEAKELVDKLEKDAKQTYVPPQEIALLYIGIGDADRAFKYLDLAYEERYGSLSALKVEPLFDNVRNDTRFDTLLDKMGLN